jgi:hypothetical protein
MSDRSTAFRSALEPRKTIIVGRIAPREQQRFVIGATDPGTPLPRPGHAPCAVAAQQLESKYANP